MAGLLGNILTGVGNFIRNARVGKQLLQGGFVASGGGYSINTGAPTQQTTSNQSTQAKPVEWYKQPWVVPVLIGMAVITFLGFVFSMFGKRR